MYIQPGLKSSGEETISAIKRFGQACEVNQAFASTIHLIARYENDLEQAIVQSVMAGGDSAARASMAALVIGAHLGMEAVPENWITQVNRMDEIQSLMDQIL
jgi:ADP-ribosylglycohydrolase